MTSISMASAVSRVLRWESCWLSYGVSM